MWPEGELVERSQKFITGKVSTSREYVGEHAWKRSVNVMILILSTYVPIGWVYPIAVYDGAGKHVLLVPAATTIDECWQLVDTVRKPAGTAWCWKLLPISLSWIHSTWHRKVSGRLYMERVHISMISEVSSIRSWRTKFYEDIPVILIPHGFGPIVRWNIHRGDKLNYLVRFIRSVGITAYRRTSQIFSRLRLWDRGHEHHHYQDGMENDHDTAHFQPPPYSRLPISGTKVSPEISRGRHRFWIPISSVFDKEKYDQLWKNETSFYPRNRRPRCGRAWGMDFIMDYRLIYCLKNGAAGSDAYDAANGLPGWLSKISVQNGGAPVRIPDFTRGDWNRLNGLTFANWVDLFQYQHSGTIF